MDLAEEKRGEINRQNIINIKYIKYLNLFIYILNLLKTKTKWQISKNYLSFNKVVKNCLEIINEM